MPTRTMVQPSAGDPPAAGASARGRGARTRSDGAVRAALEQGGANRGQAGPPGEDTADFGDTGASPGNLRVDYVLPSRDLVVCASGVYWPAEPDAAAAAALAATDHRLVWVDVGFDAADCQRRSTPTGQ
ncbi:MAG: hypothetical protein R3E65_09560 [Steroidobacteraceae bacterium]